MVYSRGWNWGKENKIKRRKKEEKEYEEEEERKEREGGGERREGRKGEGVGRKVGKRREMVWRQFLGQWKDVCEHIEYDGEFPGGWRSPGDLVSVRFLESKSFLSCSPLAQISTWTDILLFFNTELFLQIFLWGSWFRWLLKPKTLNNSDFQLHPELW